MPESIRPTDALANAPPTGVRRVVNQLYTNDGCLIVEPVTGAQVALGDVNGNAISLAGVVRTLELLLEQARITNFLLAQLKEPGTISEFPSTYGATQ